MGLRAWLRAVLAPHVRPADPPPPWDGDLVGEDQLQQIEHRREVISQAIESFRAEMDTSLQDEVDAIRRESRGRV